MKFRYTLICCLFLFPFFLQSQVRVGVSAGLEYNYPLVSFLNGEKIERAKGNHRLYFLNDASRVGFSILVRNKFEWTTEIGAMDFGHKVSLLSIDSRNEQHQITYVRIRYFSFGFSPAWYFHLDRFSIASRLYLNVVKPTDCYFLRDKLGYEPERSPWIWMFKPGIGIETGRYFKSNGIWLGLNMNIYAPEMVMQKGNDPWTNLNFRVDSNYPHQVPFIYINRISASTGIVFRAYFGAQKNKKTESAHE